MHLICDTLNLDGKPNLAILDKKVAIFDNLKLRMSTHEAHLLTKANILGLVSVSFTHNPLVYEFSQESCITSPAYVLGKISEQK